MNETLRHYFDAFNSGDIDGMLAQMTEDVAHHVNEGEVRIGKIKFRAFCDHMARCYAEQLTDLVIFEKDDRAAAEFMVNGEYLKTDGDLPEARGQTYHLPGGSFMTLRDGQISRITTYYNLADWLRQVS